MKGWRKNMKAAGGFTFIEMSVVLGILTFLILVSLPMIGNISRGQRLKGAAFTTMGGVSSCK